MMPDAAISVKELISLWSIQESLLQTYRRIFLMIEAALISVAAVVASTGTVGTTSTVILCAILFVGLVSAIIFLPIIRKRGECVFYFQALVLQCEAGKPIVRPLQGMKDFQKGENNSIRETKEYRELSRGKNLTRDKLLFALPLTVLAAWIAIFVSYLLKFQS